jgi:hypothetical protein
MKKSPWLIFVLVAIAQFMVVLDNAITNVALPSIQRNLQYAQLGRHRIRTMFWRLFATGR